MGILDNIFGGKGGKSEQGKAEHTSIRDKFFGGRQLRRTKVAEEGGTEKLKEEITDVGPMGKKVVERTEDLE